MKTAILFSGQGAQYQGMGEELYHQEAIVRETFDEASHILGYEMAELCFTENERLNETEYTQPAILTVSVAFYRLLQQKGLTPDVVAGLSLGNIALWLPAGLCVFQKQYFGPKARSVHDRSSTTRNWQNGCCHEC